MVNGGHDANNVDFGLGLFGFGIFGSNGLTELSRGRAEVECAVVSRTKTGGGMARDLPQNRCRE